MIDKDFLWDYNSTVVFLLQLIADSGIAGVLLVGITCKAAMAENFKVRIEG